MALLPSYKRVEGQYNLQGYLYKTEKLLLICPHCNADLSEIALNRFYCIGCGTEIDRGGYIKNIYTTRADNAVFV